MTQEHGEWIWRDGEWIAWKDATVHLSAHALHYGSAVFEGIRAYATDDGGTSIFRLDEHLERLQASARLLRFDLAAWPVAALSEACRELVRRNQHGACYLRPLAFRDAGSLGVDGRSCPVRVALISFEWGAYLGEGALEQGVDAAVSSWRRFDASVLTPLGKIAGQYVNNQYVSMEARDNGFDEGIVLDRNGQVCEGGGENLFLVNDGTILTPPVSSSILAGITRDTVLTLARDLGIPIRETTISRDALYLCDEIFMTGTAAEITPVRSVDRLPVGAGRRGPITKRLQEVFFDYVHGRVEDRHGWLNPIRKSPPALPVSFTENPKPQSTRLTAGAT